MKKPLLAILQFVLFFVTFAAGSLVAPMHLRQVLSVSSQGTRFFVWDGVVLTACLFLLILAIEAGRKRLRTAGPWTAAAFALALLAGLALKFGFGTT